ncbi:hypothetical protein I7I50_03264 [Histoplasma capsulatum G186AR]|uniref:Uncharacterized protein n=1 Tax=Ajellomyces capsulatus TaxID=5037 RepID=A0A8H7Z4D9_AJECA|nr:hypothetical protein I7I52_00067 [Histoplasma capsulatum]QSS72175.1 hypothetical protein I7I50_03264 [Histoplasma capsulatum G186AR]
MLLSLLRQKWIIESQYYTVLLVDLTTIAITSLGCFSIEASLNQVQRFCVPAAIHQIHQSRSYPFPLRPPDPRAQNFARRFKETQLLFALLLYFLVVQKGNSSFFQRCRTVLGYCKDIWKAEIRKGGFYFDKQPFFFSFFFATPH